MFGGAVFAVDHHEVVAESAEDLNHVGSVAGDDGPEDDSAVVEFGLGGVGAHGGTSGGMVALSADGKVGWVHCAANSSVGGLIVGSSRAHLSLGELS